MKAHRAGIAAIICLGSTVSLGTAGGPPFGYMPVAPEACGPGYYSGYPSCGPSYCMRPPFPPYSGVYPGQPIPGGPNMGPGGCGPGGFGGSSFCPPGGFGAGGFGPGGPGAGGFGAGQRPPGMPPTVAAFPTHPYARGPRDFFMLDP